MLAGNKPCPGMDTLFLLLRSRGVTVLITYQVYMTIKRVYGEEKAAEILGECHSIIYLSQGDFQSATYAADDLGIERGERPKESWQFGGEMSTWNRHDEWVERHYYSATELKNLPTATEKQGITGRALIKIPDLDEIRWPFTIDPAKVGGIPKAAKHIEPYERRDPDLGGDFKKYVELMKKTQRLQPLTPEEKSLLTQPTAPKRTNPDVLLDAQ